jgi:hypothetical protein
VEDMRREYERACRFLEPRHGPSEVDRTREISRICLEVVGVTEEKIADLELAEVGHAELADYVRSVLEVAKQSKAKRAKQKIVDVKDLESAIDAGYEFLSLLPGDRAIVKLP